MVVDSIFNFYWHFYRTYFIKVNSEHHDQMSLNTLFAHVPLKDAKHIRLLNVEFDWDPDHQFNEPPLEGPPITITIDMVKKAISKMKSGKAAGPSGIVVEMIKAAGDTGATMIRDLATAIIRDGKVPTDWEESFIVCLYKGKGDALDRGNY